MAVDDIAKGECLAVIPRRVLLSCSNSEIADLVSRERLLVQPTMSSWVPLLIALAAECSKKVSINHGYNIIAVVMVTILLLFYTSHLSGWTSSMSMFSTLLAQSKVI